MKKIAVVGVPGGFSSELLADTVERRTGFRCLVDPASLVLDLDRGQVLGGGVDLLDMDAVLIKKAGPFYSPYLLDRMEVLRYVQERGVPVFSSPLKILRVLDRLACTVTMQLGGIPMPPTIIVETVDSALDAVERYGACVFKPLFTSKARGMAVIGPGPDAKEKIEAFNAENSVMYIQQKIVHPGKDMGVTFLGGEYLGTYARVGNGRSWNTTTRSGGRYEPCEPSSEIVALAHKAQALFGLDFTCVDVAETEDGPKVFEVSAFGGFRGLMQANGVDVAGLLLDYVLQRIGR